MRVIDILLDSFKQISDLIRSNNTNSSLAELTSIVNQSGDTIKKLDELSNSIIIDNLSNCDQVREIASEENSSIITTKFPFAPFFVSIDPLDGSSNIDVNITIGSIFTIFKYDSDSDPSSNDYSSIKNGRNNIIASGYCLYGGSTQLVMATNSGVSLYTLDPVNNDFNLHLKNIIIPDLFPVYSINEGNKHAWTDKRLIPYINSSCVSRNFSQRWVGSLVADAHRTLLKGGFFSYPADSKNKNGKIRLLYEAYPMAFIFEKSGGVATDGFNNILDLEFPSDIHLKTPIYLSSSKEYSIFLNH